MTFTVSEACGCNISGQLKASTLFAGGRVSPAKPALAGLGV
jgi:hypothetical protein